MPDSLENFSYQRNTGTYAINYGSRQVYYRRAICETCGEEFFALFRRTGKSKRKYCTRKCHALAKHRTSLLNVDSITEKKCSKCKKMLPISEFYRIKSGKETGKWESNCKECAKKYKEKNPLSPRIASMMHEIKKRSKGRFTDIDRDWISQRLKRGICEVTGLPILINGNNGEYRASPYAASIDRRDSKKGYTKDNCRIVCWIYNIAKWQFKEEELDNFVLKYAEVIKRRNK